MWNVKLNECVCVCVLDQQHCLLVGWLVGSQLKPSKHSFNFIHPSLFILFNKHSFTAKMLPPIDFRKSSHK